MINDIAIKNFGPLENVRWDNLATLNLVIGGNKSGKTFLLKALYAAVRTIEQYKRGKDNDTDAKILADKLYWTFQAHKIGDLVRKGTDNLDFEINFNRTRFHYSFGKSTEKTITTLHNNTVQRTANSLFLPPKEVLTIWSAIIKERNIERNFGFDDTFFDISMALSTLTTRGRNKNSFAQARQLLHDTLGGHIEYNDSAQEWVFKEGRYTFSMGVTAEGIKKIGILDTLLGNRYLTDSSLIFLDEPETALHPTYISQFMEILSVLASDGIQVFMASHSYFVIKKLYLLALEKNISIPVLSYSEGSWKQEDMRDGMPDNAIIRESVRLYQEEIEQVLS